MWQNTGQSNISSGHFGSHWGHSLDHWSPDQTSAKVLVPATDLFSQVSTGPCWVTAYESPANRFPKTMFYSSLSLDPVLVSKILREPRSIMEALPYSFFQTSRYVVGLCCWALPLLRASAVLLAGWLAVISMTPLLNFLLPPTIHFSELIWEFFIVREEEWQCVR